MRRLATFASVIAAFLLSGSTASADVKICNQFMATIHVALADLSGGSFTAAGWWTVPPDACLDANFTLRGDTIYYAADSDGYKSGRETRRDHWGNRVKLFVGSKDFNFTDADKSRRGAKAEMFSSAGLVARPPAIEPPPVDVTVSFKPGGSSVDSTIRK